MLHSTRLSSSLLLTALASLGAPGCGGSTASPSPSSALPSGVTLDQADVARDSTTPADLTAAVAQNNAFALALYGQAAPSANGGNFLTSPISASLALTMTYAGAQGSTATQMAQALDLPTSSSPFDAQNALVEEIAANVANAFQADSTLASSFPGPQTSAPSKSDYVLNIVNSVWGEKTYPWASPFLNTLAASYGTGVYLTDFVNAPTSAQTAINDWVSTETDDKITNLLPAGSIDAQTRIVLVNAIHLKLPWQTPFAASATASAPFTRGDGSQVTASFMHEGLETGYAQTPLGQAITVPLSNDDLSVVLIQPTGSLASFVSALTPDAWTALTTFQVAGVTLGLPKFDFTSQSFSLATALQGLGMKDAFNPAAANFKGMCAAPPDGDNLFISDVLQKATMAVTETGVEAAAATAVTLSGSAAPSKEVTMTFDHPFLVSIVDKSGAIVFLGQIDDPTQ